MKNNVWDKSKYDITGSDAIIRSMTENDIDRVMWIWLETNTKAHGFIEESYWRNQYDNVKKMIPESEVYVCEMSGDVIGFIGLSENYIAGIFVVFEYQSRGIGKRLLDYAKELKPELRLHVYQKNCRAVSFYQKEDFVIKSEHIDENTGETEFLMIHPSRFIDNHAYS